jgi:3-oxoacyl-[acyl-carrier protein] reductase
MHTALVTGGARGIGRAIALDLGSKGSAVAIAYRTSEREAVEAVAEIVVRGGKAIAVRADVSEPDQVEALFDEVSRRLAAPDVLVHAAGPYHRRGVLEETPQGWRSMLANNLDSLFYCARLALPPMMAKKWGRIVAFSMANAERASAQPGVVAHSVAKIGVLSLVRALARTGAPHGVTVNAISPGFIASGSAPQEELDRMLKHIPAGHVGTLDDAVGATTYLLSDAARYVNGSNVILSGGWGL